MPGPAPELIEQYDRMAEALEEALGQPVSHCGPSELMENTRVLWSGRAGRITAAWVNDEPVPDLEAFLAEARERARPWSREARLERQAQSRQEG